MKKNKIYLAYGSNMNIGQMAYRCPYAEVLGVTELPGWRLLFRGGLKNAVATVEPCEGGSVPALLWEITPRDEEALDRYEGFPNLYRKETVTVTLYDESVEAMLYVMNGQYPAGTPGRQYYTTILEAYNTFEFDVSVLEEAVNYSAGIAETAD